MSTLGDFYWAGCAQGKIFYQVCMHCDAVLTYPRPFCNVCGVAGPVWRESARKGHVAGATTVYRAPTPEFERLVPYRLLLIDLAEKTRIIAHGDLELKVGDPVEIGFREVGERHLPYCRRAAG